MKRFAIVALITVSCGSIMALPRIGQAQTTYMGTVERVWEDGFRLNTGERTIKVDSWDVYGDNTAGNIAVGDSISVTGEFDGREFDAFTIKGSDPVGTVDPSSSAVDSVSRAASAPSDGVSYTGTVERVWEDGFLLNTGERTLRVDSWSIYGDNTGRNIAVGDRLAVTGEFDGREFDAFSISDAEKSDDGATR